MTTDYNLPNVPHPSEFKKKKFIRRDGHIYRIWDRLDEKRWQKDGNIGIFKKTKKYLKENGELDKKNMESSKEEDGCVTPRDKIVNENMINACITIQKYIREYFKKNTLKIIKLKVKQVFTKDVFESLKTKSGETQKVERKYISIIRNILNDFNYNYQEAGSQQSKDFRNINNTNLNIEVKKTDSFNVMCNDTCPNETIDYLIIFTGKKFKSERKKDIQPQIIFINGDEILKKSPWIKEFQIKLENMKNEYCRGNNKKLLDGILRTYVRPTYQFDIRTLLDSN